MNKYISIGIAILIVGLLYGNLFAKKIDLTTADLGRHLQNGKIILEGIGNSNWQSVGEILNKNTYSYTEPEQPFINHHWLSGVLYFLVFGAAGFIGLSLLNVLVLFAALFLALFLAKREVGLWWVVALSVFLPPVIASRTEVRPESFTYLLFILYFTLLWLWQSGSISKKWLYALPILQLLWVNLHIGFVFGCFVLFVFTLVHFIFYLFKKENKFLEILPVAILAALATLLNPHFLAGALYPLAIFKGYGYTIVENQSIGFLENLKFIQPGFIFWKLCAFFGASLICWQGWVAKKEKETWIVAGVWFTLLILSYLAIRNFPLFGLFSIFSISWAIGKIKNMTATNVALVCILLFAIYGFVTTIKVIEGNREIKGFGTLSQISQSAEFLKENKISGPIFNNYDVGGFLIYHLYPEQKVFTDNRPEAYSSDFFDKVYKPMQTDPIVWREADKKYNFNTIFFSHRDYTGWGQAFLISRINDPAWVPVFVDQYVIILLKRNTANNSVIQKFEIPKSRFSIKS